MLGTSKENFITFGPVVSEKKLFVLKVDDVRIDGQWMPDKLWSQNLTLSTLCSGKLKSVCNLFQSSGFVVIGLA
jgi:hypothetical protein